MTWFKVDDGLFAHPKVRRIPRDLRPRLLGLWTLAGAISSRDLTEGRLAAWDLEEIGAGDADVDGLAEAGLWHRVDHQCARCAQPESGGIVIHDFLAYNPTRDEVERRREMARLRQQRHRAGSRHAVTRGELPAPIAQGNTSPVPVPDPAPADAYGDFSKSSSVSERAREDEALHLAALTVLTGVGITDAEAVRQTIEEATHRAASFSTAAAVAVRILERAERSRTHVARPQAYTVQSIRQSWAEVQQWMDEGQVPA